MMILKTPIKIRNCLARMRVFDWRSMEAELRMAGRLLRHSRDNHPPEVYAQCLRDLGIAPRIADSLIDFSEGKTKRPLIGGLVKAGQALRSRIGRLRLR